MKEEMLSYLLFIPVKQKENGKEEEITEKGRERLEEKENREEKGKGKEHERHVEEEWKWKSPNAFIFRVICSSLIFDFPTSLFL